MPSLSFLYLRRSLVYKGVSPGPTATTCQLGDPNKRVFIDLPPYLSSSLEEPWGPRLVHCEEHTCLGHPPGTGQGRAPHRVTQLHGGHLGAGGSSPHCVGLGEGSGLSAVWRPPHPGDSSG